MNEPTLAVVRQNQTFFLATWGRVQISAWRHRIDRTDLEAMFTNARQLMARLRGEKILNLSIVDTSVSLPDDATRKRSAEMMREMADGQRASATVLEGEGFLAGAARAAFAGMILISRSPMPQKAFSSIDAAAAWLAFVGGLEQELVKPLVRIATELRRRHNQGLPIAPDVPSPS